MKTNVSDLIEVVKTELRNIDNAISQDILASSSNNEIRDVPNSILLAEERLRLTKILDELEKSKKTYISELDPSFNQLIGFGRNLNEIKKYIKTKNKILKSESTKGVTYSRAIKPYNTLVDFGNRNAKEQVKIIHFTAKDKPVVYKNNTISIDTEQLSIQAVKLAIRSGKINFTHIHSPFIQFILQNACKAEAERLAEAKYDAPENADDYNKEFEEQLKIAQEALAIRIASSDNRENGLIELTPNEINELQIVLQNQYDIENDFIKSYNEIKKLKQLIRLESSLNLNSKDNLAKLHEELYQNLEDIDADLRILGCIFIQEGGKLICFGDKYREQKVTTLKNVKNLCSSTTGDLGGDPAGFASLVASLSQSQTGTQKGDLEEFGYFLDKFDTYKEKDDFVTECMRENELLRKITPGTKNFFNINFTDPYTGDIITFENNADYQNYVNNLKQNYTNLHSYLKLCHSKRINSNEFPAALTNFYSLFQYSKQFKIPIHIAADSIGGSTFLFNALAKIYPYDVTDNMGLSQNNTILQFIESVEKAFNTTDDFNETITELFSKLSSITQEFAGIEPKLVKLALLKYFREVFASMLIHAGEKGYQDLIQYYIKDVSGTALRMFCGRNAIESIIAGAHEQMNNNKISDLISYSEKKFKTSDTTSKVRIIYTPYANEKDITDIKYAPDYNLFSELLRFITNSSKTIDPSSIFFALARYNTTTFFEILRFGLTEKNVDYLVKILLEEQVIKPAETDKGDQVKELLTTYLRNKLALRSKTDIANVSPSVSLIPEDGGDDKAESVEKKDGESVLENDGNKTESVPENKAESLQGSDENEVRDDENKAESVLENEVGDDKTGGVQEKKGGIVQGSDENEVRDDENKEEIVQENEVGDDKTGGVQEKKGGIVQGSDENGEEGVDPRDGRKLLSSIDLPEDLRQKLIQFDPHTTAYHLKALETYEDIREIAKRKRLITENNSKIEETKKKLDDVQKSLSTSNEFNDAINNCVDKLKNGKKDGIFIVFADNKQYIMKYIDAENFTVTAPGESEKNMKTEECVAIIKGAKSKVFCTAVESNAHAPLGMCFSSWTGKIIIVGGSLTLIAIGGAIGSAAFPIIALLILLVASAISLYQSMKYVKKLSGSYNFASALKIFLFQGLSKNGPAYGLIYMVPKFRDGTASIELSNYDKDSLIYKIIASVKSIAPDLSPDIQRNLIALYINNLTASDAANFNKNSANLFIKEYPTSNCFLNNQSPEVLAEIQISKKKMQDSLVTFEQESQKLQLERDRLLSSINNTCSLYPMLDKMIFAGKTVDEMSTPERIENVSNLISRYNDSRTNFQDFLDFAGSLDQRNVQILQNVLASTSSNGLQTDINGNCVPSDNPNLQAYLNSMRPAISGFMRSSSGTPGLSYSGAGLVPVAPPNVSKGPIQATEYGRG